MERNLRKKLIATLAPYVSKTEIEGIFGKRATSSFYDIVDKENLTSVRDATSERKKRALKEWEENEARLKEQSINEAKRILNGTR